MKPNPRTSRVIASLMIVFSLTVSFSVYSANTSREENLTDKYQSVSVFVEPNTYNAEPLETFSVDIKVGPVSNLMAFATEILFDPSVVTVAGLTERGFLRENGNVQTSFMKTIDNQQGRCIIAITRLTNPPSGVSSTQSNTVLTIHLKANNPGFSAINLINTGLIHPDGVTTYDAVVTNGQVHVNIVPNHATVSFNPASVTVFPEESFSSTIRVENIENLFAAAMDINFDPELLQINSITEGNFLNHNGQVSTVFITDINNELGKAVVGITRLNITTGASTVQPQNLLTINFSSVNSGLTQVNLSNVGLLAPDGVTSYPVLSEKLNVQVKSDEAFIFGTIINNETGLPVQGIVVKTLTHNSKPSNAQGQYLLKVPYGYGYNLEVISGFFEELTIPDIHVPQHDPVRELNIALTPIPVIHELVNLIPNPNPEISTVQQGGTLHRYYKLINTYNGKPLSFVPVRVQGNNFSRVFSSDERGIVKVSINSQNIGAGQIGSIASFAVVSINNEPVAEPVSFISQVTGRQYSRYWDGNNYIKLGGNFLGIDADEVKIELGGITTLKVDESVSYLPDNIFIDRQGRAGISFGFKVKSPGIKTEIGPVTAGVGAEAGVGISLTGVKEDGYVFPYVSQNNYQAVAKYILIGDGNFGLLDNTLIFLLTVCERWFSDDATLLAANASDAVGIEVKANASAEANAGAGISNVFEIGLAGNVGGDAKGGFKLKFDHHQQHLESSVSISGGLSASLSAGIKLDFPKREVFDSLKAKLQIWDTSLRWGLKFTPVFNYSDLSLKEFKLTFLSRNQFQKWEKELEYRISGEDAINAIQNLMEEITQMTNAPTLGMSFTLNNETFRNIIVALFNLLYDLQVNESGEANISYREKRADWDVYSGFDIGIEVSAGLVSGKFGAGTSFESGRTMIVEEGKWAWGRHFANQDYNSPIPSVMVSYDNLLQEVIGDLPWVIRKALDFVRWIVFWKKDQNDLYFIDDNGSYVIMPNSAIPPDLDSIPVISWSWYGDLPDEKLSNLTERDKEIALRNKTKAESIYGMEYGIGGFYQFEPYGLELADTCWITIKYHQDEIENIDENTLGVYWEDKENKKWVYLGGVVNVEDQSVTAPFDRIGLFTLAPRSPFGDFGLYVHPDSLNADGVSIATVLSDSIFNNDQTPVADGTLFTVGLSIGEILTEDADPTQMGIQIPLANGKLEFQIRSHNMAGNAIVRAYSVNGSAAGEAQVVYFDPIAPAPPVLLNAVPGHERVKLHWQPNQEADLTGYVVYYDTDTLPPFNGIHKVYGEPSPIIMGLDTLRQINGLFNDTIYYFAIAAFDYSGNVSPLSNFVSATPVSHFLVELLVSPEGAGTVEGGGEYLPWQEVEVNATPNEGWVFVDWRENGVHVSDENIHVFNIFANRALTANFTEATSIPEISEYDLKVYPNPARTQLWVQLTNSNNHRLSIQLANLQGQIVDQKIIDEQGKVQTSFNVSRLHPGVYLLLIKGDKWNVARKVVVKP